MAKEHLGDFPDITVSENGDLIVQAGGQSSIELPDTHFLTDGNMIRHGSDLILETNDGEAIVIEGYFDMAAPPVLLSDGAALTPDLVNAFTQDGLVQYAQNETMNDASPVGLVKELSGDATIIHPDGTTEKLTIGSAIHQGDIIETNADGAVNIIFVDHSTFAISNNARLAIDEYIFDPTTESGVSDFSLLRGVFVYTSGLIGREDPDDVEIETPMGSIGIRGTTIAGKIDPYGESEITVVEGAIVVKNFTGEVTLAQQFETVKLTGINDNIEMIGVTSADHINETYSSLYDVNPDFFAGIGQYTQPNTAPDATIPSQTEPQAGTEQNAEPVIDTNTSFDGHTDDFGTQDGGTVSPLPHSSTTSGNEAGTTDTSANHTQSSTGDDTTAPVIDPNLLNGHNTGGGATGTHPVLLLNSMGITDGLAFAGMSGENLGRTVASWGDLDADGLDDVLVTNNLGQGFKLQNGTFTELYNSLPGSEIAGLGDFNRDGIIDYVYGSGTQDTPGTDSGIATTSTGAFFNGQNAFDFLGTSISSAGDINGDGYADFIVGAPGTDAVSTDEGTAYVVFGSNSLTSIDVGDSIPAFGQPDFQDNGQGFAIEGLAPSDMLGANVGSAGDFNNDGFDDILVSEPGQNRVHIGFGQSGLNDIGLGTSTLEVYNVTADPFTNEIPIFNMGDMNGDGISDIAIAAAGKNVDADGELEGEIYILWGNNSYNGGSTNIDVDSMTSAQGIRIAVTDPDAVIIGGSAAGDFNGDGYADGAIAFRNGDVADIYVIYGRPGMTDLTDVGLNNANIAFHMQYDLSFLANPTTDPFDIDLASAGDTNGDGFDDLLIGMEDANGGDGEVIIVNGRNAITDTSGNLIGADGNMIHIAGQTTVLDDVIANANSQHLVGNSANNTMTGGSFSGITFNGGAGDDIIQLNNTAPGAIDGGTGYDSIQFTLGGGQLDFASVGNESLSHIENISMLGSNQRVVLGVDDIFRLMQQSDGGTLTIWGNDDTTNQFHVSDNGAANPADTYAALATELGGSYAGNIGGFETINVGSYQLLVDNDVQLAVV